jgi:hypothetical protein
VFAGKAINERLAGWVARTRPLKTKAPWLKGLRFRTLPKVPIERAQTVPKNLAEVRKYRLNRYPTQPSNLLPFRDCIAIRRLRT